MAATYLTFARYIRDQYKTKAFRISVDGFLGCSGQCIYCENTYYKPPEENLEDQVLHAVVFNGLFEVGLDLILIPGIGMHNVPLGLLMF